MTALLISVAPYPMSLYLVALSANRSIPKSSCFDNFSKLFLTDAYHGSRPERFRQADFSVLILVDSALRFSTIPTALSENRF
jgi:hypothetical protein